MVSFDWSAVISSIFKCGLFKVGLINSYWKFLESPDKAPILIIDSFWLDPVLAQLSNSSPVSKILSAYSKTFFPSSVNRGFLLFVLSIRESPRVSSNWFICPLTADWAIESFSATLVNEQYLLDLEREAFLSLVTTKKSMERLQSILTTGKPLRN